MELVIGQIVTSRAGRDNRQLFVVVGMQSSRLLLANGAKWSIAAPKSKNIRHINPTQTVLPPGQMDTDGNLRTALSAYLQAQGLPAQGG